MGLLNFFYGLKRLVNVREHNFIMSDRPKDNDRPSSQKEERKDFKPRFPKKRDNKKRGSK